MGRFDTRNIQFVNDLVRDAEAGDPSNFSQVRASPYIYRCILPIKSTGLCLLKAFVRMVKHDHFNETYRKPKSRARGTEYSMYEVKLQKHESEMIKIDCKSSPKQPGNAIIRDYGSYDVHASTMETLNELAMYFNNFLRDPMTEKWYDGSDNWKLSVLLVFEIARRTTETEIDKHEFYNLPVAAGIQMAMEIPQCPPTVLFDLFTKKSRFGRNIAFQKIIDTWTGGSMNLFQSESVTMLNTSLESRKQNQISILFEENQNLREQVKELKEEFDELKNDFKKLQPQAQQAPQTPEDGGLSERMEKTALSDGSTESSYEFTETESSESERESD